MKKGVIITSIIIIVLIILGILLFAGKTQNSSVNDGLINSSSKDYCQTNMDCIPASCCHPNSCINVQNIPNCSRIMCSQECVPGTLDCGQAVCGCLKNKCEVIVR